MGEYVEPPPPTKDAAAPTRPWLLVVGAAGREGPQQLVEFVAALPPGVPAAVLVGLDGSAAQARSLPGALRRAARIAVVTPFDGEPLHAGVCYVADAEHRLTIAGAEIHTVRDRVHHRRALDRLFASAAASGGPRVAGVMLSARSADAEGLAAIEAAGGASFVRRGEACAPDAPASPADLAAATVGALRDAVHLRS